VYTIIEQVVERVKALGGDNLFNHRLLPVLQVVLELLFFVTLLYIIAYWVSKSGVARLRWQIALEYEKKKGAQFLALLSLI
jgi:hypothetical protein